MNCECGCGQETKIAQRTRSEAGWIKGKPLRFVNGHNRPTRKQHRYEVDPVTGCWNWLLCKNKDGYGFDSIKGKVVIAHRRSYERKYGPIPEGLELDHKCRNRGCVNPDHLEPVTHKENVRRKFI